MLMQPDTLAPDAAAEITRLHEIIVASDESNLETARRIGERLTEVKASLPHGQFGRWCCANLKSKERSIRPYMEVHRQWDLLKSVNVTDLSEAYQRLPKRTVSDPVVNTVSFITAAKSKVENFVSRLLSEVRSDRKEQNGLAGYLRILAERIEFGEFFYEPLPVDGADEGVAILAEGLKGAPVAIEGVIADLAIPTLHADDIGEHEPEPWEPGPGEARIGFCPDGRTVFVETLPDPQFVRSFVLDADNAGVVYDKRAINRHWLRTALDRGHDIDPLKVEWRQPMPATAENNPAADLLPWKYEPGVSA